jgi:hypothetical protein
MSAGRAAHAFPPGGLVATLSRFSEGLLDLKANDATPLKAMCSVWDSAPAARGLDSTHGLVSPDGPSAHEARRCSTASQGAGLARLHAIRVCDPSSCLLISRASAINEEPDGGGDKDTIPSAETRATCTTNHLKQASRPRPAPSATRLTSGPPARTSTLPPIGAAHRAARSGTPVDCRTDGAGRPDGSIRGDIVAGEHIDDDHERNDQTHDRQRLRLHRDRRRR